MRRDEKGYGGWGMGYGVWRAALRSLRLRPSSQTAFALRPRWAPSAATHTPYPIHHNPVNPSETL